jgi:DNA adenine methylase
LKEPIRVVPGGKSFLAWIGGKRLLANQIIKLAPPHKTYVEVFAGAGWMLFKKSESDVEIINDANQELITLYRVIKFHLEEFLRQFKWLLVHRDEFERLKKVPADTLTDIQRAARFYYIMRCGYGARLRAPSWGVSTTSRPRLNLVRMEEDLSDTHLRLARVHIERAHYSECLTRFDRAHTWFYLDPPYYKCEDYYGKGLFERADFDRLAKQLAGIKGKFALSINDHPAIRECFKDFRANEVSTRYSVASGRSGTAGKNKPVVELVFTNY